MSERCVVKLLDIYLDHIPENPIAFYLQPLDGVDTTVKKGWYRNQRVGINNLKTFLPKLSEATRLKD